MLFFFLLMACSEESSLVPADDRDVYTDGTVKEYMKSTKGKGIDVIFMGDGFSSVNMAFGGKYERSMKQAVDYLFAIEPFKTYRDYFNVKYVVAISENNGITEPGSSVNTKFSVKFTGSGSEMEVNQEQVQKYARKALSVDNFDNVLLVVVANSTRYGGTTYLAQSGFAISICPMSSREYPLDFRGLVQHEAGGHGFGLLADEYVNYNSTVTEAALQKYRDMEPYGFYANVDTLNNLDRVKWAHFFDYAQRYPGVAAYEGGLLYQFGVWRPELTSCMIDNIPYYNAPSREAIVRRIKRLAGESYSFADFMEGDVEENKPPVPSLLKAAGAAVLLAPEDRLPEPVIIDSPRY